MKHYQCHSIWTPSTSSTRICATVKWFPNNFCMPAATHDQIIIVASSYLTAVLLTTSTKILLLTVTTDAQQHLLDLANIFHKLLPIPATTTATLPKVAKEPNRTLTPTTPDLNTVVIPRVPTMPVLLRTPRTSATISPYHFKPKSLPHFQGCRCHNLHHLIVRELTLLIN